MTAPDKAKELVNMYYTHARTQEQAIDMADKSVLTTMCQKIDKLHIATVKNGEMDENFVKPSIEVLKWWQEVSSELQKLRDKIPVN